MKKAVFFALAAALLACSDAALPARAAGGINIITEDKIYGFSYPELKNFAGEYRLSGKEDIIDGVLKENFAAAKDATVRFSPSSKEVFTFEKEEWGRAIDEQSLREDLNAALSVGGGTVYAKSRAIAPLTTVSMLKEQTFERARFTTLFDSANIERSHNIALAASFISGKEIKSGETFSFNDTVGVRSEARGFKTAKIIKDGKFEDGLGGGVCQVSTTLYNAALLSGLGIVEYHPHSLAVSYVEPSFDAMVSYGSADLKIRNDTSGSVFIAAYVESGKITFVLYGLKSDRTIKRSSQSCGIIQAKTKTVDNKELPAGETKVVASAKNGEKSKGYLIISQGGKTIRKLIRCDEYRPIDGLIEKGAETAAETGDG